MNKTRRNVLFSVAALPGAALLNYKNDNDKLDDDKIIEDIGLVIRNEFFKNAEERKKLDYGWLQDDFTVYLENVGYDLLLRESAPTPVVILVGHEFYGEVFRCCLEVPMLPVLNQENLQKIKKCFDQCFADLQKERSRLQKEADGKL